MVSALLNEAEQKALRANLDAYDKAVGEAGKVYRESMGSANTVLRRYGYTAWLRAFNDIAQTYDAVVRPAWEKIAEGAGPLVAWIVRVPGENWENECIDVLNLLSEGAALEDIDAHAETAAPTSWCHVYDDFRAEAPL